MRKVVNKKISLIFLLTYLSKTCILIENKQTSTGGYPEALSKMSSHTLRQKRVRQRKQRYKCKRCEYQFTRTTPRGHPPEHKKLTVLLYCHGISMRAISKLFQVSTNAVLKWIRTLAKKQAPKPSLARELKSSWNLMRCGIIFKEKKQTLDMEST